MKSIILTAFFMVVSNVAYTYLMEIEVEPIENVMLCWLIYNSMILNDIEKRLK